jgi:NAD(P)-dependent dehydrogenase (short-subunit alcohol dehydrogenase family)
MNGRAFAARFAKEGYAVALLSRSTEYSSKLAVELGDARAYACDVSAGRSIAAAFARVNEELGPVDPLVYTAGSGTWGTIDDVSDEDFERAWRVNVLGLFQTVRAVLPTMREAKRGNILVIGATASLRGKPFTTAFASAKAAQRSLAQSFARQLGPEGIHVAVVIIDGGIQNRGDTGREEGTYLDPDDIAMTVHHLARQPRSAWTFEVDVRPFRKIGDRTVCEAVNDNPGRVTEHPISDPGPTPSPPFPGLRGFQRPFRHSGLTQPATDVRPELPFPTEFRAATSV